MDFKFASLTPQEQCMRVEREFQQLRSVDAVANPEKIFRTSNFNAHKNRYADVFANEDTIFPSQPTPWYINGNLIKLSVPHHYVACQAPTPENIEDFWNVVCEYKVPKIFMLTREVERIRKADRYWPDEVGKPFLFRGGQVVLGESVTDSALNLITRKLVVTLAGGVSGENKEHHLTQIQYIGWPDHGVPDSTVAFCKLLSHMDDSDPQYPVVVHCSAGIGRTGTLIGAHAATVLLRAKKLSDSTVFELVKQMKRMRSGMVQRPEQYHFIYTCLLAQLQGQ